MPGLPNDRRGERHIDRIVDIIHVPVDILLCPLLIAGGGHAGRAGRNVNAAGLGIKINIPAILVLGCIACKAVQSYWNQHRDIPNETFGQEPYHNPGTASG